MSHLFCFGLGYTGFYLENYLKLLGWEVSGTVRSQEKIDYLADQSISAYLYESGKGDIETIKSVLQGVEIVLISIPPGEKGDGVLSLFADDLQHSTWVGYLSTTGVYGDQQGRWVDESTPVNPFNTRTEQRVEAEALWLASGLPIHVFRLAGIYGPGRNSLVDLEQGRAKRIHKEGQVFSRIHVVDIFQTLFQSMLFPNPGAIYNVADDEPTAQADVVSYAASLLNMEPPPLVEFEKAELSEMARSFYQCNRRVSNKRIKEELKVKLNLPTYRQGLQYELKKMDR